MEGSLELNIVDTNQRPAQQFTRALLKRTGLLLEMIG